MPSPKPPPAVTTQTSKVELPAWVDAGGQQNYEFAKEVANQPFMAYGGDRVANLTPAEQQAKGFVTNAQNFTSGALRTALGSATGAGNFQPQRVDMPAGYNPVQAQSFLNQDISRYMDPEIQNVIDPAVAAVKREGAFASQAASDQARSLGARTGSRFEVGQAVRDAEIARAAGATEAGLRSAAFTGAAGRAGQDMQSALQAALANQTAGLTSAGQTLQAQSTNAANAAEAERIKLAGGSLATQIGATASDTAGRNAALLSGMGGIERGIKQQELDVGYQNFMAKQGEAEKDLNLRLTALGMTPYGKTTSGTSTATTPTTQNPWMMGLGAAATFLPMMMSDRKIKKNAKKIAKDPETGLNIYEFDYKKPLDDGKRHIGFMAHDVDKKAPGNTRRVKVDGKSYKAVDYMGAIRDARDDKGRVRGKYRPRRSAFMAA